MKLTIHCIATIYLMCMEGNLLCTANIRNGRNYIRNQMPSWPGGLHHVYMDRTKGFGHQILSTRLPHDAADRAIASLGSLNFRGFMGAHAPSKRT